MSYDMHISLLALFYVLIADKIFRPFDSLFLISSLGFYFMYGFLINDYFDKSKDIEAEKKKTIQELTGKTFIRIILIVIFLSALHLFYLKEKLYIITYIVSYILATAYSAPPVKFKKRAISGIIVDSFIEKMLPVLAVFAYFNHFGIDTLIFLAASFCIGIIDIVTHQIYDYESDLKTGINTFTVSIGKNKTLHLFNNFINPLSGIILFFLCITIFKTVIYSVIIGLFVFLTYGLIFLLISKGKFTREERIVPQYISAFFFLIHNALPVFLALFLTIGYLQNTVLLILTVFSQYYIIKSRFNAIRGKIMPHTEIFVDT